MTRDELAVYLVFSLGRFSTLEDFLKFADGDLEDEDLVRRVQYYLENSWEIKVRQLHGIGDRDATYEKSVAWLLYRYLIKKNQQ
jgi:hypothetical protein